MLPVAPKTMLRSVRLYIAHSTSVQLVDYAQPLQREIRIYRIEYVRLLAYDLRVTPSSDDLCAPSQLLLHALPDAGSAPRDHAGRPAGIAPRRRCPGRAPVRRPGSPRPC